MIMNNKSLYRSIVLALGLTFVTSYSGSIISAEKTLAETGTDALGVGFTGSCSYLGCRILTSIFTKMSDFRQKISGLSPMDQGRLTVLYYLYYQFDRVYFKRW